MYVCLAIFAYFTLGVLTCLLEIESLQCSTVHTKLSVTPHCHHAAHEAARMYEGKQAPTCGPMIMDAYCMLVKKGEPEIVEESDFELLGYLKIRSNRADLDGREWSGVEIQMSILFHYRYGLSRCCTSMKREGSGVRAGGVSGTKKDRDLPGEALPRTYSTVQYRVGRVGQGSDTDGAGYKCKY
ncbi:uncharacterized protein RAG0_01208 [Rhynchosporium agropyri]|uniref:Uncharacterized protein n=1 Tax=Rhynchosporium agropyri TaxID=914238 RepID=A0A1E1JWP6_9HELO|nr:uncharacterized protein RAG0_01208 [Rhynchosporium agropyri]